MIGVQDAAYDKGKVVVARGRPYLLGIVGWTRVAIDRLLERSRLASHRIGESSS